MALENHDDVALAERLLALRAKYAAVASLTKGEVSHVLNNSAAKMQCLLSLRGVANRSGFIDKARSISDEATRVVTEVREQILDNQDLQRFIAQADLSCLFIRAHDPVPQLLDHLGHFEDVVSQALQKLTHTEASAELEIVRSFQEWLPDAANDAAEILPRIFGEKEGHEGLGAAPA